MRRNISKIVALLLAIVMLAALAACNNNSANNPGTPSANPSQPSREEVMGGDRGDILETGPDISNAETVDYVDTIVFAGTMNNFNITPFAPSSGGRENVAPRIYGMLFYMPYVGAPLEDLQPNLAKSWTKVDDFTYDIELFDYIHDSKGNPITSSDIKFSYEKMIEAGNPGTIGPNLQEIVIKDDYHFTIKLKNAGVGVIEAMLASAKGCIVSEDWYNTASDDEQATNPASLGLYEVEDYQSGISVTFKLVENFWQTDEQYLPDVNLTRVGRVIYKGIKEDAMRTIALESGEVDVAKIGNTEISHFFDTSTMTALPGYTVTAINAPGYFSAVLNMSEGSIFADNWNLRMAVLCAINSTQIQQGEGLTDFDSEVLTGFGSTMLHGYNPEVHSFGDDWFPQEKASEYLEAAGYKPGELTVRLLAKTSLPQEAVDVMVAQLEMIGINVDLNNPTAALEPEILGDSTAWDINYTSNRVDGQITDVLNEKFDPSNYGARNSVNFMKDDKLVELLAAASYTGSEEDISALSQYLYELAVFKPTICEFTYFAAKDDVLKIAFDSIGNPALTLCTFDKDYVSVNDR